MGRELHEKANDTVVATEDILGLWVTGRRGVYRIDDLDLSTPKPQTFMFAQRSGEVGQNYSLKSTPDVFRAALAKLVLYNQSRYEDGGLYSHSRSAHPENYAMLDIIRRKLESGDPIDFKLSLMLVDFSGDVRFRFDLWHDPLVAGFLERNERASAIPRLSFEVDIENESLPVVPLVQLGNELSKVSGGDLGVTANFDRVIDAELLILERRGPEALLFASALAGFGEQEIWNIINALHEMEGALSPEVNEQVKRLPRYGTYWERSRGGERRQRRYGIYDPISYIKSKVSKTMGPSMRRSERAELHDTLASYLRVESHKNDPVETWHLSDDPLPQRLGTYHNLITPVSLRVSGMIRGAFISGADVFYSNARMNGFHPPKSEEFCRFHRFDLMATTLDVTIFPIVDTVEDIPELDLLRRSSRS